MIGALRDSKKQSVESAQKRVSVGVSCREGVGIVVKERVEEVNRGDQDWAVRLSKSSQVQDRKQRQSSGCSSC